MFASLVVGALLMLWSAGGAWGQSFFVQPELAGGDAQASEQCGRAFASTLTEYRLIERMDAEVEQLVRRCVEDMSSPGFVRDCDLVAARGTVSYIVGVVAEQERDEWHFDVRVLSPLQAGVAWQRDLFGRGESPRRVSRSACRALALDFLLHQDLVEDRSLVESQRASALAEVSGGGGAGGGGAAARAPSVLEVGADVTPRPVGVRVNGEELGMGPGQFVVPSGRPLAVELYATGYRSHGQEVSVSEGETLRLGGIRLEPLPGVLVLEANVQGAVVRWQGRDVGRTILGGETSMEVSAGQGMLRVEREGYVTFERTLEVLPGARVRVSAVLEVVPVLPVPVRPDVSTMEGELLRVRAGSFRMGSPANEEGRHAAREAQVEVHLTRDFLLGRYPVTQGQYQAVMGTNPSHVGQCGPTCPVESVSWLDAIRFTNRLNALVGLAACYDNDGRVVGGRSVYDCVGYRLPTEAEWEYAVRAGTTGARYGALDSVAWHSGNSGGRTHPVGGKQANAWGFHDMLGNVWEWTDTRYQDAQSGGTDPAGPSSGFSRVLRGGSWFNGASRARAAWRSNGDPGHRNRRSGFRLARSAP